MITRISIQTAGLAFGGTGLCTYRVTGVDGSCAEHLTGIFIYFFYLNISGKGRSHLHASKIRTMNIHAW